MSAAAMSQWTVGVNRSSLKHPSHVLELEATVSDVLAAGDGIHVGRRADLSSYVESCVLVLCGK